ncbi:hypothetical protein FGIG_12215 [Fasciola gigantica]|uniref:Uncharacterized protein n=1 Tax=Fasciola gigantica TaxID=46835 RepID=A0A504YQZ6_FASGI|nr:hypothetical protein FGIG_12215 [Fasciola gigantica]
MALVERLRKKLAAVNYPTPAQFDPTDSHQIRNFIVWLEDRIIRALPIEKRFRDIESTGWSQYSQQYLLSLKCPFTEGDPVPLVDWLLGKALLLDFKPEEIEKSPNKSAPELHAPKLPEVTPSVTLMAACILINEKLSKGSIEKSIDDYGRVKVSGL